MGHGKYLAISADNPTLQPTRRHSNESKKRDDPRTLSRCRIGGRLAVGVRKQKDMKTLFKIGLIITLMGWFAFMWIAAVGWNSSPTVRVGLAAVGIMCCLFGSFTAMYACTAWGKGFWMNQKHLWEWIEKHRKSIEAYDKAKEKLVKKIESL